MKFHRLLVIAFLAICASSVALATTATANMAVSSNVPQSCILSTSALSFGAYDPIVTNATTPLDQTATLTVTCSVDTAAKITLGQGSNAGTGSTDAAPLRRLKDTDGDHFMNYNLYTLTDHATVWGNTDSTAVAYTGSGVSTSVTVFGRVAAGQNLLAVNGYTDTIVVTITF